MDILKEINITWFDDYYEKFDKEYNELTNKKEEYLALLNKNCND